VEIIKEIQDKASIMLYTKHSGSFFHEFNDSIKQKVKNHIET
jgi:hypothetical protein